MDIKKDNLIKAEIDKAENNKKSSTEKIIPPVSYPDSRAKKSNIAVPSDYSTEISKEWVDFNKL